MKTIKGAAHEPDPSTLDQLFHACRINGGKTAGLIISFEHVIKSNQIKIRFHKKCLVSMYETKCVICLKVDKMSEMISPQNEASWQRLIEIAQAKNWEPIISIAQTGSSLVKYHSKCRDQFTHVKTFNTKSLTQALSGLSVCDTQLQSVSPTAVQMGRNLRDNKGDGLESDEICIFCQKKGRYQKNAKTREVLRQAVELRADVRLRSLAIENMDDNILKATSTDIVASEKKYHPSCYKDYTRTRPPRSQDDVTDPELLKYQKAERQSYEHVLSYIQDQVLEKQKVMPLTEATNELITNMQNLGVQNVKAQTKKHLRRKIESTFKNAVQMFSNDKGSVFMYAETLSITEVLQRNLELEKEADMRNNSEEDQDTIRTAEKLRRDIKRLQEENFPIHPDLLKEKSVKVPDSLLLFLQVLVSGKSDQDMYRKEERTILSLAQDMIYGCTYGRVKPPKHILLAWVVKSLTGNVELIKFLNRSNHCISYTQLEEIETCLCLDKLANNEDSVILPSFIVPGLATTLAYDNIDRTEETLSGEGTSHRVNGIVIQEPSQNMLPPPVVQESRPNKRKRTLDVTTTSLPPFNAGARVGPSIKSVHGCELDHRLIVKAKKKDYIWSFIRQSSSQNQKVASWTGFNILTRNNEEVSQDKLGYLPTINSPATQLCTVNEVLQQSLKILKDLDLKEIVVVFDQAMYAKATEIAWKNQKTFGSLILRMGDFHTVNVMHSIIGKRFEGAGLKDLVVEAKVIAEGSLSNVLDGKMYNRGMRLYKLVYEAFLRLIWKGFIEAKSDDVNFQTFSEVCQRLLEELTQDMLEQVLQHEATACIFSLFEEHLDQLRNNNGDLSKFWMSCLDLIDILLCLVRAAREGDWRLHIASIKRMIPWCFAYGKINYARYLSAYVHQMDLLPIDHPDTYQHFLSHGFSVQLGPKNPFGRIPIDQAIEESVNKDTQTPGGTKGFSLKPAALSRYYLTAEFRSHASEILEK